MSGAAPRLLIRDLGFKPLPDVWADMQTFTSERVGETPDEIWFVEHPPVYTLGMRGDRKHVLASGDIPVVQIDRGGQVTYHGPGQQVVYVLLDLRRLGFNPRTLVQALESAVIDTVAGYGVAATARRDAPGIYVAGKKLGAIGLRVRRHCSYHGLAVNVAMDLEPFAGNQSVRLRGSRGDGSTHALRGRRARAFPRGSHAASLGKAQVFARLVR